VHVLDYRSDSSGRRLSGEKPIPLEVVLIPTQSDMEELHGSPETKNLLNPS
jgi:hypothetical protein